MSEEMNADDMTQDTLEQMLNGVEWEEEVIDDMLYYLSLNPHPESLDLLYLKAAVKMAEIMTDPIWQSGQTAWYYYAPQIVAGEYPLEKLPEGAVRNLAKELYYGGRK
jgi:hypothetical protein